MDYQSEMDDERDNFGTDNYDVAELVEQMLISYPADRISAEAAALWEWTSNEGKDSFGQRGDYWEDLRPNKAPAETPSCSGRKEHSECWGLGRCVEPKGGRVIRCVSCFGCVGEECACQGKEKPVIAARSRGLKRKFVNEDADDLVEV